MYKKKKNHFTIALKLVMRPSGPARSGRGSLYLTALLTDVKYKLYRKEDTLSKIFVPRMNLEMWKFLSISFKTYMSFIKTCFHVYPGHLWVYSKTWLFHMKHRHRHIQNRTEECFTEKKFPTTWDFNRCYIRLIFISWLKISCWGGLDRAIQNQLN